MNAQVKDLISALGPSVLQGVIQLFQAVHPVPTNADQATKDTANAAKAAGALATASSLASTLAPTVVSSMDAGTLSSSLSGALEVIYQQLKASGALVAPITVVPVSAAAKPLATPIIITGATLTGNWQAPK